MKAPELIATILAALGVGVLLAKVGDMLAPSITAAGNPPQPATVHPLTDRLAVAIAAAEGFSIPGSVPNRNHNPGDLRVDTIGKGIAKDPLGFVVYATDEDGWSALRKQASLMLTNTSRIYNRDMTIAEVANKYTATARGEWASIVAQQLGVSTDTRLSDI